MNQLKVFIKSDRVNERFEGVRECFVTTEELETYKITFEQLARPTLDEVKLMFIQNKDNFEKVED